MKIPHSPGLDEAIKGLWAKPYYGFDGELITMKQWGKLFESPERIFGKTKVTDHEVSTVWLGIDHGFSGLKPLIFETMVFCQHESECVWSYYCERYATKEEALVGHAHLCNDVLGIQTEGSSE